MSITSKLNLLPSLEDKLAYVSPNKQVSKETNSVKTVQSKISGEVLISIFFKFFNSDNAFKNFKLLEF